MSHDFSKKIQTHVVKDNYKLIELLKKTEEKIKSKTSYAKVRMMYLISCSMIIIVTMATIVNTVLFFLNKRYINRIISFVLLLSLIMFCISLMWSVSGMKKLCILDIEKLINKADAEAMSEKDWLIVKRILLQNCDEYMKACELVEENIEVRIHVEDDTLDIISSIDTGNELWRLKVYREERPDEEPSLYITPDYIKLINVSDGTYVCESRGEVRYE